mmetsp:Transcript_18816/g.57166  ORF Transcript_18816/g.57166 Transcript_18816/m.57166 type:complete len:484 (+) Transcript_18816:383-1834(+)
MMYLVADVLLDRPTWKVYQGPQLQSVVPGKPSAANLPHSWVQFARDQLIKENVMGRPNVGFLTMKSFFPANFDIGGLFPADTSIIGAMSKRIVGVDSRNRVLENDNGAFHFSSLALATLPGVETFTFEATAENLQSPASVDAIFDQLADRGVAWKVFVLHITADCENAELFLKALNERFPGSQLVGGLVEPHPRALMSLHNGVTHVFGEGLVGMAMAGDLVFNSQVSHANHPLSDPFVITSCKGDQIYKVRPYKEGEETKTGCDNDSSNDGMSVLDPIFRVIQATGGNVPFFVGLGDDAESGYELHQLTSIARNRNGMETGIQLGYDLDLQAGQHIRIFGLESKSALNDVEARLQAAQETCAELAKMPLGGLLFTCGGRGLQFYGRSEVESSIFQRKLPGTPLSGIFALGEVGPAALAGSKPGSLKRADPKLQGFTAVFGVWFVPRFNRPNMDRFKKQQEDETGKVLLERREKAALVRVCRSS